MTNTTITKIIEMEKEFDEKFINWKCHGCKNSFESDKRHRSNPSDYCDVLVKDWLIEQLLSLSQLAIERLEGKLDIQLANADEPMDDETRAKKWKAIILNDYLNQEIEHHREIIKFLEQR